MAENVEVTMSLKEAQVWTALQKLVDQQKKGEEGFEKMAKASKSLADEQKKTDAELAKFAEKTKAITATPLEKYQQQMHKLTAAVAAGKLSEETFARACAKAAEELDAATESATALTDAAADLNSTLGGGGVGALGEFTSAVAGVELSLDGALAKFKEMIEFAKAQRQAGGASLKSDFEVYQGIAELSGGDQKLYSKRIDDYEQLRSKYGLDRDTAAKLQETAISTGNEAGMERFASTVGAGNPAERMRASARLETLSRGRLNEAQADVAITAAAEPSQFTRADMAKFVATAASMSESQGANPIETLSTMAVMSDVLKGPEAAADRLQGYQAKLSADKRFQGKGILGATDALTALSEEERNKFLSSDELKIAYSTITQNRAKIDERQKFVRDQVATVGTDKDIVLLKQKAFEGDPRSRAVLDQLRAEQEEEGTLRDAYGTQETNVDAARARMRAKSVKRGDWAFQRWGEDKAADQAQDAGLDVANVQRAGTFGRWTGDPIVGALLPYLGPLALLVPALRENTAATKESTAAKTKPAPNPVPTRK